MRNSQAVGDVCDFFSGAGLRDSLAIFLKTLLKEVRKNALELLLSVVTLISPRHGQSSSFGDKYRRRPKIATPVNRVKKAIV